ncbi:MAG TPA: transcription-repair coupling factor, partial [Alcanivorax sp.]|nr:transcription-repair coupling factor [Alcanivorax sp.]
AGSKNADQLKELQVEMIDRFGLLPDPVKNLFQVTELRQQAEKLGITRLDAHGRGGKLEFAERTPVDPLTIVKLVQSGPNVYKLEGASTLRFELESETAQERIEVVEEVLNRLSGSNA